MTDVDYFQTLVHVKTSWNLIYVRGGHYLSHKWLENCFFFNPGKMQFVLLLLIPSTVCKYQKINPVFSMRYVVILLSRHKEWTTRCESSINLIPCSLPPHPVSASHVKTRAPPSPRDGYQHAIESCCCAELVWGGGTGCYYVIMHSGWTIYPFALTPTATSLPPTCS